MLGENYILESPVIAVLFLNGQLYSTTVPISKLLWGQFISIPWKGTGGGPLQERTETRYFSVDIKIFPITNRFRKLTNAFGKLLGFPVLCRGAGGVEVRVCSDLELVSHGTPVPRILHHEPTPAALWSRRWFLIAGQN